jgi:hypothetical protein
LGTFWASQKIAARQGGYYGRPFAASCGVTQGDIVSPTIFNVCVNTVISQWFRLVVDSPYHLELIHKGVGMRVLDHHLLFYADDGKLSSADKVWLQFALDQLVSLFELIGLSTNTEKTKAMVSTPSHLHGPMSTAAYDRRMTGEGDSFQTRKRKRVACPACQKEISAGSLQRHMRRAHGLELPEHIALDENPPPPSTHTVSVPRPRGAWADCPVAGCTGHWSNGPSLRRHFRDRHPLDTIIIRDEGAVPLSRCERCLMFVSHTQARLHPQSLECGDGEQRKFQRESIEATRIARTTVFEVNGKPIETVTCFTYLGRPLSFNGSDWMALAHNLSKARRSWGRISRLLVREGATPKISGLFYQAVVQQVLLFGSETWNISPAMLRALESFHHRAARRISGRMARLSHGEWVYPPLEEALELAGLLPVREYISRRQNTVAEWVANRPVLELCTSYERMPGAMRHKARWWHQAAVVGGLV